MANSTRHTKKLDIPILISKLVNHLKKLAQEGNVEDLLPSFDICIDDNSVLNKEVTEEEVNKCILKSKK